jgi:hypothetical protein
MPAKTPRSSIAGQQKLAAKIRAGATPVGGRDLAPRGLCTQTSRIFEKIWKV